MFWLYLVFFSPNKIISIRLDLKNNKVRFKKLHDWLEIIISKNLLKDKKQIHKRQKSDISIRDIKFWLFSFV